MSKLNVKRHIIEPHKPRQGEEYDPGQDLLIVVHQNPNDPNDPTEFGHHILMQGLAYRKEMWGLADYASTLDMELKDLGRYYARDQGESIGVHPLAEMTEHYFEVPPVRMRSFAPAYVMQRITPLSMLPQTTDGMAKLCIDVAIEGIDDVKTCLAAKEEMKFPCRGMTGLSLDSASTRSKTLGEMEGQPKASLVSSKPLDAIRQLLTDKESELERSRDAFVSHTLLTANVPEIMRQRVKKYAVQQGFLEDDTWI